MDPAGSASFDRQNEEKPLKKGPNETASSYLSVSQARQSLLCSSSCSEGSVHLYSKDADTTQEREHTEPDGLGERRTLYSGDTT